MKHIFIFVVCGAKEHIDTLHFSLYYLKKYTKNEIWVLTDNKRNEIPIKHDFIVDVEIPKNYDHHQASIFLKTGIHHHLPKEHLYCYLDTDIIAVSPEVDDIFMQYQAPISFAPDHCTMEQFSAYAVNCDCLENYEFYRSKLENELIKIDPLRQSEDSKIKALRKEIIQYYELNKSFVARLKIALRYLLSGRKFCLTDEVHYDKKTKEWKDKFGLVFMHKLNLPKQARKIGLKWNYLKNFPALKDGRNLWRNDCYHLPEYIQQKFGAPVLNKEFQHWNGGVFLFNDDSHQFLDAWFHKTMEVFKDSNWKTRDQGTLIATVWEFGLQNHPTLSRKWNLIADYHNPFLQWKDNEIQFGPNEFYKPAFVHVYHHFADEKWNFWNELIKRANARVSE